MEFGWHIHQRIVASKSFDLSMLWFLMGVLQSKIEWFHANKYHNWLVVWNIFYCSVPSVGNLIIPTDELTPSFFRGVETQPPTSYWIDSLYCYILFGYVCDRFPVIGFHWIYQWPCNRNLNWRYQSHI